MWSVVSYSVSNHVFGVTPYLNDPAKVYGWPLTAIVAHQLPNTFLRYIRAYFPQPFRHKTAITFWANYDYRSDKAEKLTHQTGTPNTPHNSPMKIV
jgi:hypothetical protein